MIAQRPRKRQERRRRKKKKNPQAEQRQEDGQVEKYKRDDKRTETRGFIELDEKREGREEGQGGRSLVGG